MSDQAVIGAGINKAGSGAIHKSKSISTSASQADTHAVQAQTIPAKFIESCQKYPEKTALLYKKDHTFGHIQYKRLLNLVQNFTLSLEKLGVKKGDRVVLISENRPEWAVADLSVQSLGAILVPIHKVSTPEQIKEMVGEVEPSLIIVSDAPTLFKARLVRESLKKKTPVVFYEIHEDHQSIVTDNDTDFISALQLIEHEKYAEIYDELIQENDNPNDVASIIYTPSPKGGFKGVQLTHKNFLSNVENTKEAIEIRNDDRFMSVLPLSHAFEKTAGYYVPLFSGATISYLTDLADFTKATSRFKPTIIVGVPRLYEKTYQKTMDNFKRSKFKEYFSERVFSNKRSKYNPTSFIYKPLVHRKVKKSLGGKVRFLVSGGASLNQNVGKFFESAGIPLLEGYGLTETAPIISVNRLDKHKIGTVGTPLPNVHVKIADDGEIMVQGPNVTPGYFKKQQESQQIFDDGWLHTGDYGELDEDGFLKITGKKKEIIVLTSGKNVSPQTIEHQLIKSQYIKQAYIIGDGKKCIAALIIPDFQELELVYPMLTEREMLASLDVKTQVQRDINKLLKDFAPHEQLKKFDFINELHSKKLNRHEVECKYEDIITKLFEDCC